MPATKTKNETKKEVTESASVQAVETMLKEVEKALPTEWCKLAKQEAESFEKADISSLAFFKESRVVLATIEDRKNMVKRLSFWIENSFASKGVINRLIKIVKLANDSVDFSVGVADKNDKTHVDINIDLIYFYNLEEVIKLKKLMTKEFNKQPSERVVSGNKIKEAQREINSCLMETDKLRYNNKLTETIATIKSKFGVIDEDNFQVRVEKKIESFENWLKSLPADEAGKILAKINKDFSAWKKSLTETPAEKMEKDSAETSKKEKQAA